MAEETTTTNNSGNNNTLMKVLCYFSYLWLIPFFVVKGEDRNEGMITHLRQGFGTMVLCLIANILQHTGVAIMGIVALVLMLLCCILGLIGVINAVTGKNKVLPIFGGLFQSSFTFIK